ncbi:MAG: DUF7521 family protein [Candidatus Syntropharchaeia archaeon]
MLEEQINGFLATLIYLAGGALIIFIYDAYRQTKQKNLLLLALGLFILVIGSNLPTFAMLLLANRMNPWMVLTISQCIQIPGVLLMLYSALKG